jgi:hypothetical protein
MSPRTVTLKASELIEDFSIYPRNCVFDGHVYDLTEAARAGAVLPPIRADETTKRITDGFHRRRSLIRLYGDDAEIEVTLIPFASDADMVRDAIASNAVHGRRLTTADIARCVALGKKFKITRDQLADLLHVTRDKLKDITATRFAKGANGSDVVLRRPMAHLAGKKLTKKQEEVAEHVGGQTALYHANRLIDLIESRSLPDDENLIERLRQLHEHLEGLLVA